MSYKVYKSLNYFVVHDNSTSTDVIRQVRDLVRWEKKGTLYSFYYNTPNLTTSGNAIIRLGTVYEFSDLVDSTGSAWASQDILDLYLEQWTGHICCNTAGEDSLYDVQNTDGTSLKTGAIPSGEITAIEIPDITFTDSNGTVSSVPAGVDITATPATTPTSASANLLQTGQTVSLSTNDDITRGRATNFTTLSSNNPFGNTNRFTSTTGNQTYSNGIVVDWSTYNGSTVLCYYISDTTFRTWTTQLNQYISSTIGGLNGWHLWNRTECYNLLNPSVTGQMNYAPFNFGGSQRYYFTSTSIGSSVVYADLLGDAIIFQGTTTSNSLLGVWVRYSTVTGTTLS